MSDERRPGESWAQWGARTGRYRPDRIEYWEGRLDDARYERVAASAGVWQDDDEDDADDLGGVVELIRSMTPVYASAGILAASADTAWPSETPLLDAEDRALSYPGSGQWNRFQPDREREQDRAAEASIIAQREAEEDAVANGLTDEEYDALFERPY